jgi:hypothetical protein
MKQKWKPAVLAIACKWSGGLRSASLRGIAGNFPAAGDGLRQGVAEVGVLRVAAVARPEARVDGQLHQVGQTPDLLRAGGRAAGQGAEPVQVDRFRAVRFQVGVDEGGVRDLVVGVVVDVLVHVLVQHLDRLGVVRIPASAGDFAVLDARELVVLLPEIGLDDLGGGQEAENRRVALGEAAGGERLRGIGQQPPRAEAGCSDGGALEQEGTATGQMLRWFACVHDLLLLELAPYRTCHPIVLVSFDDGDWRRLIHPRGRPTSIAGCWKPGFRLPGIEASGRPTNRSQHGDHHGRIG